MRPPALLVIACGAALALGCKGREARRKAEPTPVPGDAAPRPAVPDRIEGTLTLGGQPLAIVKCRPGHEGHEGPVYVDLVTAAGALRFVSGETERMFWNPRPDEDRRGAPIDCAIPHRSWGGGARPDGASYFRGELAFSCRGSAGAFEGKISLDCGDISPLERRQLDEERRRSRAEQGLE